MVIKVPITPNSTLSDIHDKEGKAKIYTQDSFLRVTLSVMITTMCVCTVAVCGRVLEVPLPSLGDDVSEEARPRSSLG